MALRRWGASPLEGDATIFTLMGSATLPVATQNVAYGASLSALISAGIPPYSIAILSQSGPNAGLYSASGLNLQCTPSAAGVDTITVQASDSYGYKAKPVVLTVLVNSSGVLAANAMAINFATGYEVSTYPAGMRHWKNAVRESSGFNVYGLGSGQQPATLNAQGWPTENFYVGIWTTSHGSLPAWATGGYFNCGFSGSGAESVAPLGGCTISNISQSAGNTTFQMTATGGAFGYNVTNVTQAVTGQFAYMPEYNTLSGIDNPLAASSITNEAIAHYSNYAFIRFMGWNGVLNNTMTVTAAGRSTPSSVQAVFNGLDNGQANITNTIASPAVFTAPAAYTPVNGYLVYLFNSGTNSSPGVAPAGFAFGTPYYIVNASGHTFELSATSGGAGIAATTAGVSYGIGNSQGDGVPQEWCAALCMACGCGMWLNMGPLFDSTFSYVTAVANALYALVPAGIPIWLEIGDELWNGVAAPSGAGAWAQVATTYTPYGTATAEGSYLAYQLHNIAAKFRAVFGSRYGTDVRLVLAWQTGGNGVGLQNNVYKAYAANGWTVSAFQGGDLWNTSIAPYMLTGYTSGQYSNSIAQIEATLTTNGSAQAFASSLEQNTVMGLKYGLRQICYEGGWETNNENTGLVNAGASILDSGMTAVMENYYQTMANSGAWCLATESGGIDSNNVNTNLTPADCLGITYPISSSNSPRFAAILASKTVTPTRNVVSSGGTIPGGNYLDTTGGALPTLSNDGEGAPFDAPNYGTAGQVSYLIYSATAQTLTLSVNFSNTGSAGTTGLEWGGDGQPYQILGGASTPTAVAIPAGTNTVTIGAINLPAGHSYVCLGTPGTNQPDITINSLTLANTFNFVPNIAALPSNYPAADTTGYAALNIPSQPAGYTWNDTVTGVKTVKVTASGTPNANQFCPWYSSMGLSISLPWGPNKNQYTLAFCDTAANLYFVDYTLGAGGSSLSNYRTFNQSSLTGFTAGMAAFSRKGVNPHILYYLDSSGKVHIYDTTAGVMANVDSLATTYGYAPVFPISWSTGINQWFTVDAAEDYASANNASTSANTIYIMNLTTGVAQNITAPYTVDDTYMGYTPVIQGDGYEYVYNIATQTWVAFSPSLTNGVNWPGGYSGDTPSHLASLNGYWYINNGYQGGGHSQLLQIYANGTNNAATTYMTDYWPAYWGQDHYSGHWWLQGNGLQQMILFSADGDSTGGVGSGWSASEWLANSFINTGTGATYRLGFNYSISSGTGSGNMPSGFGGPGGASVYFSQAHATISHDGKLVMFGSNMMNQARIDLFIQEVPLTTGTPPAFP
jgi:hypothetical protein